MKITAVLLFIACLQVSAKGKAQTVSLNLKDAPLEEALREIKQQTGYRFVYTEATLRDVKNVTIKISDATVDEALAALLKDGPLTYAIEGMIVVLKTLPPLGPDPADRVPIHGKVRDGSGNGLAGATITIIRPNANELPASAAARAEATQSTAEIIPGGTTTISTKSGGGTLSVLTDANGIFGFIANVGDVIEVSYVGYKKMRFTVTRQTREVNVLLSESQALMNEVTVSTGYQTMTRAKSTGAITRVEGEDIKDKSNSMNIVDLLEGQVPGLAVNYGQGSDKFLIRGVTSVNANRSPLYVLDGIPISYDDVTSLVNPNDVENVQVLRDAVASSVWGAQAANGVVVITTKSGKTHGRLKVQYNSFVSLKGLPDFGYQKMMSSGQLIQAEKEIFDPSTYSWAYVSNLNQDYQIPIVYPHEQILYDENNGLISADVANQRLDSLASLNNRSQIEKYLMQHSMLTNHSLSISGGNPFYSFYGSFNFTDQQNIDRSGVDNYMINLRQNFAFNRFIRLDIITTLSQQVNKQFIIPDLPNLNTYLPYAMFRDAAGNPLSQSYLQLYSGFRQQAEQESGINLDYIPLNEANYTSQNQNKTVSARVNAGLTINILPALTFEGRYQYQDGNNSNYVYYDQNSYYTRRELVSFTQPGPVYYLPSQGGDYISGNANTTSWDIRNQLNFNKSWGKHGLNLLAGAEVSDNLSKSSSNTLRGYDFQSMTYTPYDEYTLLNTGVQGAIIPNSYTSSYLQSPTYTQTQSEIRFVSLYSTLAYTFDRNYNLNASVRTDQSNLFGADISKQYKPIWAVGGSWLVSGEPFFHSKSVNSLKLRLTYGIGGNSPKPGSGGPYDIIQPQPSPFYTNVGQGYSILLPSNKSLTWESTATLNAGVDLAVLESRITLSLDVYHKKTDNLLGYAPFDPTNGWASGYTNLGNIDNKGVELSVRSLNISKKNFSWSTNFNFAYNHNEVVKLGQTIPLDAVGKLGSLGFVQGYSAYSLFDVKYAGLDNLGDPQIYTAKGQKTKSINDLSLDDVHYAGSTQPTFYGGMTNTFRYKDFQLAFLMVYNLGYKMRDYTDDFFSGRLVSNINTYFNDRWKSPGDETKTNVPRYISSVSLDQQTRSTAFYTDADINIESASYLKMRDITLSYNLPAAWAAKLSMDAFRVYAQLNNLLLWTANKQGIDPEYFNLGAGGNGGSSAQSGSAGQILGSPTVSMPDRMKPFWTFGVNVSFK